MALPEPERKNLGSLWLWDAFYHSVSLKLVSQNHEPNAPSIRKPVMTTRWKLLALGWVAVKELKTKLLE